MAKPSEQQPLWRELEEIIRKWLDEQKLVGDTKGAVYYISYEHEGELYKELRETTERISQK